MKASEVIKMIQDGIDEHGDLKICQKEKTIDGWERNEYFCLEQDYDNDQETPILIIG